MHADRFGPEKEVEALLKRFLKVEALLRLSACARYALHLSPAEWPIRSDPKTV